jgi:hypothetical protein
MADKEADALHDNPRSPRRGKEKVTEREKITEREAGDGEKAAEPAPEGDAKEGGYLGGDKEPGEGSAKREVEAAKEKPAGDGAGEQGDVGEPDMKMRREMFKRHEAELNDHHALQLKALKDMQKRHTKELGTIFKMQPGSGAEAPKKTALHGGEEK